MTKYERGPSEDSISADESETSSTHTHGHEKFTAEEEEIALAKWRAVKSWDGFLDLNRAFLRGEANLTSYHRGPLYAETQNLAPALIRLHDYGILTFQSQPAKLQGPIHDVCPCCEEEIYSEEQQCPFVSFLLPEHSHKIPEKTLAAFLVELMADDKFYTSILKIEGFCKRGGCPKKPRVLSNLPKEAATHIDRVAATEDEISDAEPRPRLIIEPDCACMLGAFDTDAEVIAHAQPLLINVLAKKWEEEDLPGLVEKAAISAGMGKVYVEKST